MNIRRHYAKLNSTRRHRIQQFQHAFNMYCEQVKAGKSPSPVYVEKRAEKLKAVKR